MTQEQRKRIIFREFKGESISAIAKQLQCTPQSIYVDRERHAYKWESAWNEVCDRGNSFYTEQIAYHAKRLNDSLQRGEIAVFWIPHTANLQQTLRERQKWIDRIGKVFRKKSTQKYLSADNEPPT